MTYRHPSILAAAAVTVDHVSAGRLELGLGAAWFAEEHERLGVPFPPTAERVDRFAEAVQVIRLLMTTDGASLAGRYYTLRDATYLPRPVQQPHPPFWIGAGGDRMLGLAARFADVWHSFGSPQELAKRSAQLDRFAEQAGRDPGSIKRASNLSLSEPLDEVRGVAEAFRAAGFDYLVCDWPGEGRQRIEEFANRVLPELADQQS
jgi:alkanesulfonate monooxygenase SsuD/methylene tetrahydromethanopterin reductase-like flavin-dependent oxidoreductase (luciferase family)